MKEHASIAILGAGAWGTALATCLSGAGHQVRLWGRDADTVFAINTHRLSPRFLPGIILDPGLSATTSMADALGGADVMLLAIPAQALAAVLDDVAAHAPQGAPAVLCAKGIDRQTGKLLSELLVEKLPGNPAAALSGPSFAADVGAGLPTAVTIAARDRALAQKLARILSAPALRLYATDDLVGVEIGGALKNVLAIAAGAANGAGLGASAVAALITRGFVELRRLGLSYGARPETLMGLSGLGDLILTCSSAQSRNFSYGMALGRRESLDGRPLAEGVATAAIAASLAKRRGVDAPIISAVAAILDSRLTIGEAVDDLLARPLKDEDS